MKRLAIFHLILIAGLFVSVTAQRYPEWYQNYRRALALMDAQQWDKAAELLEKAIEIKWKDSKKTRLVGTIFTEYYPHRELGICYFYLKDYARAKKELALSLRQAPTKRAKRFYKLVSSYPTESSPAPPKPSQPQPQSPATPPASSAPASPATMVGERLSIAVLPFQNQGLGQNFANVDILDKLITAFVNLGRFKVIERAQLEKILQEQSLAASGIIDATTAAEIGKGIGVDGVVVGSITYSGSTISIDARLIDTETAAIISAQDAYSYSYSLEGLSKLVKDVAEKVAKDIPLVQGVVIKAEGENITIDMGTEKGIRKFMKGIIYREGEPIIHPVTGKVIGKQIKTICEIQFTDVFPSYSIARVTKHFHDYPKILDKVITK